MALYRIDLQNLARIRIREAKLLLNAGLYVGAYHIAGFSLECALKACIARNVRKHEFPDKDLFQSKVYTHQLEALVKCAGLDSHLRIAKTNASFDSYWSEATKWSPEFRYKIEISKAEAIGFYKAITARKHGIMQWIRAHW
jgi:hypothetical protein